MHSATFNTPLPHCFPLFSFSILATYILIENRPLYLICQFLDFQTHYDFKEKSLIAWSIRSLQGQYFSNWKAHPDHLQILLQCRFWPGELCVAWDSSFPANIPRYWYRCPANERQTDGKVPFQLLLPFSLTHINGFTPSSVVLNIKCENSSITKIGFSYFLRNDCFWPHGKC